MMENYDIQTALEKMLVDKLQNDEDLSTESKPQLLTNYFYAKGYLKRNI